VRAHTSMRPLHQHRGSRLRYKFWLDWRFVECTVGPARSEAQYAVGYTALLGERLLFFRDFAFELSHAPFELFNHTIKLLDGSVDVVAENF
jgi:hypothetical protein